MFNYGMLNTFRRKLISWYICRTPKCDGHTKERCTRYSAMVPSIRKKRWSVMVLHAKIRWPPYHLGNILNIGDSLKSGRFSLNRETLFIICVSFGKLSPESWPESLFNVGSWPGLLFNRWLVHVKLWPSLFLMRVCSYHGLIKK